MEKRIDELLKTCNRDIQQSIKECFNCTDITSLQQKKSESAKPKGQMKGPGKTPTLTTSQNFRTKLFTALKWLFDDEINGYCVQVIVIE